jgi:hypothetical protein
MFGITWPELVRFFIQFGVAVSGAASLWGFVFFLKHRRSLDKVYQKFSELLVPLFLFGLIIFLAFWWIGAFFIFVPEIFAHEGIVLRPTLDYVRSGFAVNFPMVLVVMMVAILHAHSFFYYRDFWKKYGGALWAALFLLFSAIASLSVFTGTLGREQLFFSLHNWHSILTLGSVIVVDYLFLGTFHLHSHKKSLYTFFPIISLFIWIGLAIDFLSNVLIFSEAFRVTEQFLFIQTVVAFIIINGALLSGRINSILIHFAQLERHELVSPLIARVISVSGSVSIVSWLTITFVDFFEFAIGYWQFFGVYLLAIVVAYLLHDVLEAALKRNL